jgi:hypothetical protein
VNEPGYWQRRALREHDRFLEERDRRHVEGDALRERALTILQTSQETALGLQRDAQAYRDEQANKLREQINSERNLYATKEDLRATEEKLEALVAPLLEALQRADGSAITRGQLIAAVLTVCAVLTAVAAVLR